MCSGADDDDTMENHDPQVMFVCLFNSSPLCTWETTMAQHPQVMRDNFFCFPDPM